MTESIPAYIEARIRQPIPADSFVVANSTPVLAFGRMREARVASVGLNPSKNEFLGRNGNLLVGAEQRLATLPDLGVTRLTDAPASTMSAVFAACNGYFARNPYRRWFDQLERVLLPLGASFYAGSACHLDLVQWATNPVWRALPRTVIARLVAADREFLRHQLSDEHIRIVLLNGIGVIRAFAAAFNCTLHQLPTPLSDRTVTTQIMHGRAFNDVLILGWSTNLQSSVGVTNVLRERIAHTVAKLAAQANVL